MRTSTLRPARKGVVRVIRSMIMSSSIVRTTCSPPSRRSTKRSSGRGVTAVHHWSREALERQEKAGPLALCVNAAAPLSAALVRRGNGRLLHREGSRRMSLAYANFEEEPGRRAATKLLNRDEARRIAANVAKLPARPEQRKSVMRVTPTAMIRLRRSQSPFRKSRPIARSYGDAGTSSGGSCQIASQRKFGLTRPRCATVARFSLNATRRCSSSSSKYGADFLRSRKARTRHHGLSR
jgi:hypothetical protein